MYLDRKDLYSNLERLRSSTVLVYITGDRPGLETQISQEVHQFISRHLNQLDHTPEKISLYLYTRGGDTLAAWSIANLIIQYCEIFEVIAPSKARSGGTLICLGANNIVMTKQATLGPIDPSVNTPLNPPVPEGQPGARVPVSVEAINGFLELARKEMGIKRGSDMADVLSILSSHVHPLVLGSVYRTRSQIRMLGLKLLSRHMQNKKQIDTIIDFLCSESGSHDYAIFANEAKKSLNLNIESPNDELNTTINLIFDDIATELLLTETFNPGILLGTNRSVSYNLSRALIETVNGGSHQYRSKGQFTKQQIPDQHGIPQDTIQDNREYEGWIYENP